MVVAKLSTKNLGAFTHLIPPDIVEELKAVINRNPDKAAISEGYWVYGAYNEYRLTPQGALVAQLVGYTMLIRSVYVDPDHRGLGAADMLLTELLADVLAADDVEQVEMLAAKDVPGQMEVADFLATRGFVLEDTEEKYYRTSLHDILSEGKLSKVPCDNATALKDVPDTALRTLSNELNGKETTFVSLPLKKDDYESEISQVTIKDGVIQDLALLEKDDEGLILSYAFSQGNGLGVMTALASALRIAEKKYGAEALLRIPTMNEASEKLVNKIAPGASCRAYEHCYYSMLPVYARIYGREKEIYNGSF